MPPGAKIAIGVCVPVGVLLIAALFFTIWRRRKKARAGTSDTPPPGRRIPDLKGSEFQSELDPSAGIIPGSAEAPLEIDGAQRFETDGTQRLELPGDSGRRYQQVAR